MIVAAALSAMLLVACPPAPESAKEVRAVVISLDGMADWVLDRLLAEGRMPNLARLLEMGTAAEHAWTTLPAITAVDTARFGRERSLPATASPATR